MNYLRSTMLLVILTDIVRLCFLHGSVPDNGAPATAPAPAPQVVLFSFGLTVDFFVGHKTLTIESGDALIFNGAAAHGVVHGFARPVRAQATYRGQKRSLVGMASIDDLRLSVQARQS